MSLQETTMLNTVTAR